MTLLGIDFGTGGCKVTAIDASGRLLNEASVEYPTLHEHPGWSEQDPQTWLKAMSKALQLMHERGLDLNEIEAISLDGSTHNAVLLDGDLHPVRKTIMWTDQRSTEECEILRQLCGTQLTCTGQLAITPTWTLPQLLWITRHEPEIPHKTKHLLFVKDYVRYLLTGVVATDYIEAEGTLFFDMVNGKWSNELFKLTGFDPIILPPLIKPTDQAGTVTREVATACGLRAGIPVICGTSDSAVEDYGAGAVEPGDCIVKLATAGNVNVMTSERCSSAGTLTYSHVIPGMYYTVAATNAAALCQRYFRDLFGEAEKQEASRTGEKIYDLMDKQAATSPVGANGVRFHPYLQGERSPYWDPQLRGSFTGLSISNTRGDFMRSLLEGVAFSLLDCYRIIAEMKLPIKQIFLIGGGARSRLWSTIVCDIFNLPVQIPTPGDASFGAALLAGVGTGVFKNCREAVTQCLSITRKIQPNPERAELYAQLFQEYRQIHDALAPIYQKRCAHLK